MDGSQSLQPAEESVLEEQKGLKPLYFSPSQINTLMKCSRMRMFERHYRIEPRYKSPSLALGSCWHMAMDRLRSTWNKEIAMQSMRDAFEEVLKGGVIEPDKHPLFHHEAMKLEVAFEAYCRRYASDPTDYEWLSIESRYEFPLGINVAGRNVKVDCWPDAVARDKSGRVWLVESKTASMNQASREGYWKRLPLDMQVLLGVESVTKTLGSCEGVLYDVTIKVGTRQSTKLNAQQMYEKLVSEYADPELFRRAHISIPRSRLDSMKRWLVWILSDVAYADARMEACANHGEKSDIHHLFPQNPNSCFTAYGECPYLDCCVSGTINPEHFKERVSRRDQEDNEDE